MSRFTTPPQIQQLKAANAGQIAFCDAGIHSVSRTFNALVTLVSSLSKSLVSAFSLETPVFSAQTPVLGAPAASTEVLLEDSETASLVTAFSLQTPVFPAGESPTISRAIFTSVS
jgi:hypothetical protein